MREETESHALYELTATLARSTGSRRLPKLKSLLSNASALTLSRQQSSPQATLQLLQTLSTAAGLPAMQHQISTSSNTLSNQTSNASSIVTRASAVQRKLSYESDAACKQDKLHARVQSACQGNIEHGTDVMSREAMLLFGPSKYAGAFSKPLQQSEQEVQRQSLQKQQVSQLLEAITYEEKYHRAGREVLGQRVDLKAAAAAKAEHCKRRRKRHVEQLGYTPFRLHPETVDESVCANQVLLPELQHGEQTNFQVSYRSVMSRPSDWS